MPAPAFRIPPVVTFLILGGAMWLTARAVPGLGFAPPARTAVAVSLGVAGIIIALLGVASFRRARTTVNPLQPDAATSLVSSGIYRLTRNPMYLGLLLLLLGWAVRLGHVLVFAFPVAYVPLMNRLQIIPEEMALAAKFGPAFTAYQSSVRRWL